MHKRGDERILSLYWFAMFVIISVAVVSGVLLFYSYPLDVRPAEAGALADNIINCFVFQGNLRDIPDNVNLESFCHLSFRDTSHVSYVDVQYYVELNVNGREFLAGTKEWKSYCDNSAIKKNIPVCVKREISILDSEGNVIPVSILSVVRKVEQNAK